MTTEWTGLFGSLVGGGLALLGSIWAVGEQAKRQSEANKADENRLIAGFLGAVHAELRVCWERYEFRVRPTLLAVPPGDWFNFIWLTEQDYFTVYAANAALLGRVRDPDLRAEIVEVYTFAKGVLDSLKMNAKMVKELDQLDLVETRTPLQQQKLEFLTGILIQYATGIKQSDAELAGAVEKLFPRLEAARTALNTQS